MNPHQHICEMCRRQYGHFREDVRKPLCNSCYCKLFEKKKPLNEIPKKINVKL